MDINTFNAGKLSVDTDLLVSQDIIDLGNNAMIQVSALTDEMKIASNVGKYFYLANEQDGYQKDTFYKLVLKDGNYEFITLEEDNKTDTVFTFADGSQYFIERNGNITQAYLNSIKVYDTTNKQWLSAITDVRIGNTVATIAANAFKACSTLSAVTIPTDMGLGNTCFSQCSSLISVVFEGNAPSSVGTTPFKNINADCKIYVHQNAEGWPAEGEQWNDLTIAYIENT